MEYWELRDPNKKSTTYQTLAVASAAGLLVNPLDVVKNYQQAGKHFVEKRGSSSMFDVIKFVYNKRGFAGFLSGTHLSIGSFIGRQFIFFEFYQWIKEDTPAWWAAMKAKVWMHIFMTPLDLARTRSQVTLGKESATKYLAHVVEHEGFTAMWRGIGPLLARDIPFTVLYWSIYEQLRKEVIYNWDPQIELKSSVIQNVFWPLAIGTFTGAVVTVATQPLDVMKNVMQGSDRVKMLPLGGWQRKSFDPGFWKSFIHENGGFRKAMFCGLTPRLLKIPIACGVMLSIFEATHTDLKDGCGRAGFMFE